VVELRTWTGEPRERRQTQDPAMIGYLRIAHPELDTA
jgi:hypothetical protein